MSAHDQKQKAYQDVKLVLGEWLTQRADLSKTDPPGMSAEEKGKYLAALDRKVAEDRITLRLMEEEGYPKPNTAP